MNNLTRNRLLVMIVVFIGLFSMVIGKLAYIHIYQSDELRENVQKDKTLERITKSQRGSILDRNGEKLAFSTTKYLITYNKLKVLDRGFAVKKLAGILELSVEEIDEKIDENPSSNIAKLTIIYDKDVADKLIALKLRGIWIDASENRKYPNGTLASHLLGRTLFDDENKIYKGEYGVEKQYNEELTGTDGLLITEKDRKNNELVYAERFEVPVENGNNIVLTIDQIIQYHVEKALKEGYEKFNAKGTHAIIMDVNNGEILAMASYPDFNPNNRNEVIGYSDEEFSALTKEEQSNLYYSRWRNALVSNSYELGSTLKLVTAAIALEENLATPETTYDEGNKVQIADKTIRCWIHPNKHGVQTLTQAIENSCNPVFVKLGQQIGKDTFYDYFEDFGLTEKTGIPLPAETGPQVYKRHEVNEVELATMTFGHGIATTPIQIITAISAIVNGGYLLEPHVLKRVEDAAGNIITETKKTVKRQVISSITSEQMRQMMQSVVDNGSGQAVYTEGIPIGAKTGTSEKPFEGSYNSDLIISSFIAVAPIDNPQIALYVFVDEPEGESSGSKVAAPIAKSILDNILGQLDIRKEESHEGNYAIVPNVIGMSILEAKEILKENDLVYATTPLNVKNEAKIVLDQYPKAGTKREVGSTVILEIN